MKNIPIVIAIFILAACDNKVPEPNTKEHAEVWVQPYPGNTPRIGEEKMKLRTLDTSQRK